MNRLPYLLMFALLNSCIELEISAPSFPSIMAYFEVNESVVGLTITLNLIGFCIAAIVYGPLSDRFGRRTVMLLGNGVLAIGATLCVIAPTMEVLLIARFIQGVGAATSAVVVSAIIADCYDTEKASRLYGLMNAVFTSFMAIAPVIGGAINASIGWRGNYGVVAGICLVSWVLLLAFLPETLQQAKTVKLSKTWTNYKVLIADNQFLSAASIPSLLYACYLSYIAVSPFIYRHTLGLSMLVYTLNIAVVIACFAIASLMSGKLISNFPVKRVLHTALGIQSLGSILMCYSQTAVQLTLSMACFAIGFAVIYPIVFARSMELFPDMKGTASSLIMSLRYLICAVLTALTSYSFNGGILSLAMVLLVASALALLLARTVILKVT